MSRSYDGPPLDRRRQYVTGRAELDGEDELVYATDPEPPGRERTENVPLAAGDDDGGDVEPSEPDAPREQATLERWAR